MEEPPLQEKRDPTMFMDGEPINSDPTMYVEGNSVEYATNEGGYADSYMRGIDEEAEYDSYDFNSDSRYMTSETDAEYAHGRPGRDPTYYQEYEEDSFRTREPSVAEEKSGRKKSKKSKKSSRRER